MSYNPCLRQARLSTKCARLPENLFGGQVGEQAGDHQIGQQEYNNTKNVPAYGGRQ